MLCPDCGYDNIPGVDLCDKCEQPLTMLDLPASELEQSISRHSIAVLNPKEPISISATSSAREAIHELHQRQIGCLLILDNQKVVGVVTDRDILIKVSADLTLLDQPVSQIMTADPMVVHRDDSIAYCLRTMDMGGYRHLPVVEGAGTATGIISVRDILRFLCVRFAEIRSALE